MTDAMSHRAVVVGGGLGALPSGRIGDQAAAVGRRRRAGGDAGIVCGHSDGWGFRALNRSAIGVVDACAISAPKQLVQAKRLVASGAPWAEAQVTFGGTARAGTTGEGEQA